ncbi:MAG TPA: DinB family protein [Chloroflexota bacterium]|nr:DinB family protein [Chloroflexota bacterium]
MTERAAVLTQHVRAAGAALIHTVAQVDDADWGRVVEDGVWSPGKDAEHVTQGAAYHQWLVRTTALGDTSERTATTQRDIMVARLPKSEVLALLQQRTDQSARLVESLSDEQLDLPAPRFGPDGPPRTVAQMIEGQMIRHYYEHRENIEAKLRLD